jgi:hypothetical protein
MPNSPVWITFPPRTAAGTPLPLSKVGDPSGFLEFLLLQTEREVGGGSPGCGFPFRPSKVNPERRTGEAVSDSLHSALPHTPEGKKAPGHQSLLEPTLADRAVTAPFLCSLGAFPSCPLLSIRGIPSSTANPDEGRPQLRRRSRRRGIPHPAGTRPGKRSIRRMRFCRRPGHRRQRPEPGTTAPVATNTTLTRLSRGYPDNQYNRVIVGVDATMRPSSSATRK